MRNWDYNKITDALETIKQVCEESSCKECPFGVEGDTTKCNIQNASPLNWHLREQEEIWRAFK